MANAILNPDFEDWSAGADQSPDDWTVFWGNGYDPVGAFWARESTEVYSGTYSLKLISAQIDYPPELGLPLTVDGGTAYQDLITETNPIEFWRGKLVVVSAWVKTSVANTLNTNGAYIQLDGGGNSGVSLNHPGDGQWHKLRAVCKIAEDATNVNLFLQFGGVNVGDAAYFDAVETQDLTPIYTRADLENINDDTSGNYYLANDIDLSDSLWTPLGLSDFFDGVFDGNGYSITNMSIEQTDPNDPCSLFGYAINAELRNVTLENVTLVGNVFVCALVGVTNDCIVNNIRVNGVTISLHDTSAEAHGICSMIGGVQGGWYSDIIVTDLNMNISGSGYFDAIGGLVGGLFGSDTQEFSGFFQCLVMGDISISKTGNIANEYIGVGGLFGFAGIDTGVKSLGLDECLFKGNITVNAENEIFVGGVVGGVTAPLADTNELYVTMSNSFSEGEINVTSSYRAWVGGFIGINSEFPSKIQIYCSDCYSFMNVSVQGEGAALSAVIIGGFIAAIQESYFVNCYAVGKCTYTGDAPADHDVIIGGFLGAVVEDFVDLTFNVFIDEAFPVFALVNCSWLLAIADNAIGLIHLEVDIPYPDWSYLEEVQKGDIRKCVLEPLYNAYYRATRTFTTADFSLEIPNGDWEYVDPQPENFIYDGPVANLASTVSTDWENVTQTSLGPFGSDESDHNLLEHKEHQVYEQDGEVAPWDFATIWYERYFLDRYPGLRFAVSYIDKWKIKITAINHGLSNGDRIKIVGVQGMTELNGNDYFVSDADANTFILKEASPIEQFQDDGVVYTDDEGNPLTT